MSIASSSSISDDEFDFDEIFLAEEKLIAKGRLEEKEKSEFKINKNEWESGLLNGKKYGEIVGFFKFYVSHKKEMKKGDSTKEEMEEIIKSIERIKEDENVDHTIELREINLKVRKILGSKKVLKHFEKKEEVLDF